MYHFNDGTNSANYSSDMSGQVSLRNGRGECIEISGKFILDFVANYVACQRIAKLEQATTKEILGI